MPRPSSTTRTDASGQMVTSMAVAVAGQGFVDGVVDHLVDQVVQTPVTGGPDVHARPHAYRLEAFEDLDIAGVVRVLNHSVS